MSKNILLVDDDDSNRMLVAFALKSSDYAIYEAISGGEGLELAEQIEVHIALIDIELPDMNGLSIIEELRPSLPDALMLILTANDSPALISRACLAGANAYIVKPFDLPQIIKFIKEMDGEALLDASSMLIIDNRTGTRYFEC